jgi:hypothetical protein
MRPDPHSPCIVLLALSPPISSPVFPSPISASATRTRGLFLRGAEEQRERAQVTFLLRFGGRPEDHFFGNALAFGDLIRSKVAEALGVSQPAPATAPAPAPVAGTARRGPRTGRARDTWPDEDAPGPRAFEGSSEGLAFLRPPLRPPPKLQGEELFGPDSHSRWPQPPPASSPPAALAQPATGTLNPRVTVDLDDFVRNKVQPSLVADSAADLLGELVPSSGPNPRVPDPELVRPLPPPSLARVNQASPDLGSNAQKDSSAPEEQPSPPPKPPQLGQQSERESPADAAPAKLSPSKPWSGSEAPPAP